MSLVWSDWCSIDKPTDYKHCAVYEIRLCCQKTPISISRFLGVDERGLLCIGKAKSMEKRRKQFVNSRKEGDGHSEGNLLHRLEIDSTISTRYPDPEYEYSFAKVNPGQENRLEEQEIKAYVKQFGEVPPLNSAIPNRYGVW